MPYSLGGSLSTDIAAMPEIASIIALLAKVSEKFEPETLEMQQWMSKHSHNPHMLTMLRDMTEAMLRVLDTIGRLEPVNGITISKQAHMHKGTVSKATRRLIDQQLISTESLPNNKKEVLFRTTPLGKELFLAHQAFNDQMERDVVQCLQRYNADELQLIIRVLQDVAETSFAGLHAPISDREANL
jgi:DNA-binding MarR family transcriptional regulator